MNVYWENICILLFSITVVDRTEFTEYRSFGSVWWNPGIPNRIFFATDKHFWGVWGFVLTIFKRNYILSKFQKIFNQKRPLKSSNYVQINMKKMLHKNAIKYVKQEYTLIFIYYVIRFGSVRIPKLRYSVFRNFTRFSPPLHYLFNNFIACMQKNYIITISHIWGKRIEISLPIYFWKNFTRIALS